MSRIEALGLEANIPSYEIFHDDGFVMSINQHTINLALRYNYHSVDEVMRNNSGPDETSGRTVRFRGRDNYGLIAWHTHIFCVDTGDPILNALLRAHESTHALDNLKGLEALERKIYERDGVRFFLGRLKDKELMSNVGAVYGLPLAGFLPEECAVSLRDIDKKDECFEDALRRYREKQKKKGQEVKAWEAFLEVVQEMP